VRLEHNGLPAYNSLQYRRTIVPAIHSQMSKTQMYKHMQGA